MSRNKKEELIALLFLSPIHWVWVKRTRTRVKVRGMVINRTRIRVRIKWTWARVWIITIRESFVSFMGIRIIIIAILVLF